MNIIDALVLPAHPVAKDPELAKLHLRVERMLGEYCRSDVSGAMDPPEFIYGLYAHLANQYKDRDWKMALREGVPSASVLSAISALEPPENIRGTLAYSMFDFWELRHKLDRDNIEPSDEFIEMLEKVYNSTPSDMIFSGIMGVGQGNLTLLENRLFEKQVKLMEYDLQLTQSEAVQLLGEGADIFIEKDDELPLEFKQWLTRVNRFNTTRSDGRRGAGRSRNCARNPLY